MFSEVNTYAPDEVYLSFGGYTLEGWNSISVKKTVPTFRTVQGIRGKNTRVRNRNNHAIIEIAVDMTSDANTLFSQIVALDREIGGAVLHLTLIDKSGSEVFSSNEAYVQDESDRTYDNSISSRLWQIECLDSNWSPSTNGSDNKSLFDIF